MVDLWIVCFMLCRYVVGCVVLCDICCCGEEGSYYNASMSCGGWSFVCGYVWGKHFPYGI